LNASVSNLLLPSDPPWHPCICVASGPSFTEQQAKLIVAAREQDLARVIVVNDNWLRVPNADLLYACDGIWWDKNMVKVRKGFNPDAQLATADSMGAAFHGLQYVELCAHKPGLCKEVGKVYGSNSGYHAITLAWQLGARKIFLVGFDMQRTGGKTHWFGEHAEGLWNYHPDSMIASWAKTFIKLADDLITNGAECINCTIQTALTCFKKSTLEVELGKLGFSGSI